MGEAQHPLTLLSIQAARKLKRALHRHLNAQIYKYSPFQQPSSQQLVITIKTEELRVIQKITM